MADTKISALAALTGALSAADDEFPIVDTSAGETKRMTRAELVLAIEANLFTGPVVVGAAAGAAGANDLVVDGAIYLGGSVAANALDDYEEGTWTPNLSDGTNSDATQTIEIGHYTKIGDLVHVQGRIATSSLGTISGNIQINGLPFVSHNITDGMASAVVSRAAGLSITAGQSISGYIDPNTSTILLLLADATTGTSRLLDTEFSADGDLMFSASYIAA
ncbi:MAG: hypothetical protein L3J33_03420 [Rhodobacteraceae bacterium]|nr:hypothetical protein [Paracoccaceae bacterium]